MCGEKMEYQLFINYPKSNVIGTNETGSNFSYSIQGLLPIEHKKYRVKMEHIIIEHKEGVNNIGDPTYLEYTPAIYNVLINFNKGPHIYSSDDYVINRYSVDPLLPISYYSENYVNVYTGLTKKYEKHYYYDVAAGVPDFVTLLTVQALEGRNGQEIIIDRPRDIINIKIVDAVTGSTMSNAENLGIYGLRMLLKFTPI